MSVRLSSQIAYRSTLSVLVGGGGKLVTMEWRRDRDAAAEEEERRRGCGEEMRGMGRGHCRSRVEADLRMFCSCLSRISRNLS